MSGRAPVREGLMLAVLLSAKSPGPYRSRNHFALNVFHVVLAAV